MTKPELTPKQEHFAQCIAQGMSQSDAYRTACDVRPKTKPETIWNRASKLMAEAKVSARVEELREAAKERTAVTVESLTETLKKAVEGCEADGDWKGLTQAVMAMGKLNGLVVEKRQNENTNKTVSEKSDGELERELRELRTRRAATDRTPPPQKGEEEPRPLH